MNPVLQLPDLGFGKTVFVQFAVGGSNIVPAAEVRSYDLHKVCVVSEQSGHGINVVTVPGRT